MDPKPTSSSSSATNHSLSQLDPTIIPPSTIQNISYRFSKLYANHKKSITQPPLNSQPPLIHPEPDTYFEPKLKPLFVPRVSDTSCTTLTKSNSQRERRKDIISVSKIGKIVEKEHYFIKKPLHTGPKKQSFGEEEECTSKGVKTASQLMSKSLDSNSSGDEVKKISSFQQAAAAGIIEVSRRSSTGIPGAGAEGRRKSFCSSGVELADFFSCTGTKVVAVDMPPFMQIHAVDSARKARDSLEKFTSKSLALTLKREFDGAYGPAWHCIVGTSFGSFVTHSVGGFMYFSMDGKLYVLLFKTSLQRAE